MIDIDSLTLGEVAKVESLSGLSISQIAEDEKPKGLALAALVFVFKRREDPEFTWNKAQDVTVTEAQEYLEGAAADPDADEIPGDVADPELSPFPPQLADES
jgi:hypothetical protein